MSKQVDERVVSMQFDNSKFERNVSTTMSTLDKLKAKLKFDGASKGLENVGSAAKKVDMSSLGNGIETVHAKFSALQVMGVTALANITNSAVNAGKRIASALTIDPVKSGFQEYETQINAVQTILANTQSKGTTLDQVNEALDELNLYADKTIYNFTEMTRNIGTFTAAGVDLETSVNAIQGIANLAAVSGSTSQQASTAMYQLSQALAAGTVNLTDWNSVVNAGMGGQVFQDALKKTSELLGTGAEAAIKAEGSFRESLRTGWLTAEVLTETLKGFTTSGANEYIAEYTGLSAEAVEAETKVIDTAEDEAAAIDKAAEALANKSGKNKEEIKSALEMAYTAQNAATKVKTFTQLIDTLKESLQSGWTQTWEILIGDFEEATSLWTGVSDFLGGFIEKMSNARNELLEKVMNFTPIAGLTEKLNKVTKAVETVTEATKDYGKIVDRVIGGEFGNGQSRWDKLTEQGYDWAHVQNLVNEKLGDSTRHATNYKEAQEEVNKTQSKTIEDLLKMSDAQLENLGFTKKEIEAFRELEVQSKKTGIPIKDLIEDTEQLSGRSLLLNSFKNIGQSLVKVFSAIGKAWKETFNPIQAETLYDAIAAFHKFTKSLIMNKETSEKLTKTFKGVFSIIKLISTITGGVLKIAFKVVSKVLEGFGLTILDVTAIIGEAISKFEKFVTQNKLINKVVSATASAIVKFIKKIKELAKAFWELEKVQDIVSKIKDIGTNIIEGLKKGLQNGIKTIPEMLANIGRKLLEAIKKVLGIHSPSKETEKVGTNIIDGLVNGLKNGASKVFDIVKGIGEGIVKFFKAISWANLFAAGISIALVLTVKKLVDVVAGFASVAEGLGDMFEGVGYAAKKLGKVFGAVATNLKAKALKEVAIGIALLAASVFLLAQVDTGKLFIVIGAIGLLGVILGGLVASIGIISKIEKGDFSLMKLVPILLGMSVVLLILASVVKKIGSMDFKQALQGFGGLIVLLGIMIGAFKLFSLAVKGNVAETMGQFANLITKLSISLILLVGVCKLISKLSVTEMVKGGLFVGAFLIFIKGLMKVSKGTRKNMSELGKTVLSISFALLLMVGVCKLIGMLSVMEMIKGGAFAAAFVLFVNGLKKVLKTGSKQTMAKIGGVLLSITVSLMLMVGVCKLISTLTIGEMIKGGIFVGAFVIFLKSLLGILKIGKKEQIAKVSLTILAIAGAIAILAGISIVLGLIPLEYLSKGIIAVGLLSAMMTMMIYSLRGANDVADSLMKIAICIGIMAVAITGLSFIDSKKLATATGALMGLMAMFAVLIAVTKLAKNTKQMQKTLLLMTGIVIILTGLLVAISFIPMKGILEKAEALGIIVTALGISFAAMQKIGKMKVGEIAKSIISLTAMVIPLAAFAAALNYIPMDNIAGKKEAILILAATMTAMSVLLLAVSAIGALNKIMGGGMLSGIVGLTAMCGLLAGFAWALNSISMDTISGKKDAIILLTGVMVVMSGLLLITSAVGAIYLATAGIAATGLAGLLIILGLFVGFAWALNAIPMDNIMHSIPAISMLTQVMTILGDLLFKLAIVGPLAIMGVTALGLMTGLMVAIGIFATKVGILVELFPSLEKFLNTGLDLLARLAEGLGTVLGKFVDGFLMSATEGLPEIGTRLSDFMENASGFIEGAKGIDEDTVSGVKSLAGAILAITAANLMSRITEFVPLSSSFASLGTELSNFIRNSKGFIEGVKEIDPSIMEGVKALSGAIMELTAANMLQQIMSFLGGEVSFADFGIQLEAFGKAICTFSNTIEDNGGINEDAVKAAANAGKIMSELQSNLQGTGGVVQFFAGEKNLATFGLQLLGFGKAICGFSNTIVQNGGINEDAINAAKSAGDIMTELNKNIVSTGGVVKYFAGEKNLATFGTQIKSFGRAMVDFSKEVEGKISEDAVSAAKAAGDTFAALAKALPKDGSIWDIFKSDDKMDFESFGKQIVTLGEGLVDFSEEVSGNIDNEAVKAALSSAKTLVSQLKTLDGINLENATKFDDAVKAFVSGIKKASNTKVSNIDNFVKAVKKLGKIEIDTTTLTSSASKVKKAIDNLMKSISTKISGKKSNITKAMKTAVSGLPGGVKSKKSDCEKAAKSLCNAMVEAIKGKKDSVKKAGKSLGTSAKDGAKSKATGKGSMESAGKDLGNGLVKGIEAKEDAAYDAGFKLGQAAVQGEKDGQQSNSPSKATMKAGKWLGEGLVIGIEKMGRSVYNSGRDLGATATNSISGAISKIVDVVNSDMDTQPTIRPVIDLSDVNSGVRSIDGMFSSRTLSINTDSVGTISARMGNYQNGSNNSDVVSAIKALRKDISDMPRNTYSINGITYDDGSNIADAVSSLVRAARIESRV